MNQSKKLLMNALLIMVLLVGCATTQQDFYIDDEPSINYGLIEPQTPSVVLDVLAEYILEEEYIYTPVNDDDIQCEMVLLYTAFLESKYWAQVPSGQSDTLINVSARITDKHIFDFDGDDVLDLWFRAVLYGETEFVSPRWSASITGFATIVDGEVVLLLSGYTTGGSAGGNFVAFGYDQETSEDIIIHHHFAGGFGGIHNGSTIYSMKNGELTPLHWFSYTHFWAPHTYHGGDEEHIFIVNGEDVCYDVYTQTASRFVMFIDW